MILETIEMLNPAQREAVEQTEGPDTNSCWSRFGKN